MSAFSLKTWKTEHGLSIGTPMDIYFVKQLFQDLGVGPYLFDPSEKCDWSVFPFREANTTGWIDGT